MLSLKKKTLLWTITTALIGTVGLVAFMDNKTNIFRATDAPTKQCVGIYFGNADYSSGSNSIATNSTSASGSKYYTITNPAELSFNVSSVSGSAAYKSANTTDTSYAVKLGSSNAGGSLTMTENGVRIYHVDARLCKVTYSGSSSTVGAYVDAITTTSTVSTVVSHSNTVKYGNKDTSYKLLTALDHAGVKHRSTIASVNNASLWQDGDTFNYSTYKSQFDVTTSSNDGNGFHYSVAFSNMSASGITLTITHVA